MSPDAHQTPLRQLSFVGFPERRAALLAAALAHVRPAAFAHRVIGEPLGGLNAERIQNSAVVVLAEEAGSFESALRSVRALRKEKFFWEPIHLLGSAGLGEACPDLDWAIYFHSSPPDVARLAEALTTAEPLSESRRREIGLSAIDTLANDLTTLKRAAYQPTTVAPDRIRQCVAEVLEEMGASPLDESYESLREEVVGLSARPSSTDAELSKAIDVVIEAEGRVRDEGGRERLLSRLHTLNNVLRLSASPTPDTARLARRISFEVAALERGGLDVFDAEFRQRWSEAMKDMTPALRAVEGREAGDTQARGEVLERCISGLFMLSGYRPNAGAVRSVNRIVVVEDDPEWRERITELVKVISLPDEVKTEVAVTLTQAQALLRQPGPALALIDLGLPAEQGGDVIHDAGLSLIRHFTGPDKQGKRFQHRFIVLTASGNYSEAVREAMDFGVSPASYLQKNPDTWESELTAQIRLALQAPSAKLPTIEIFKRTGRVARVEGLEVKLESPQWCLLAALAAGRKGRWNEPEKLANVLYWNYQISPDSRSQATDNLDPEERILLQLPHYASDLRQSLARTYARAVNEPLVSDILSYDEESGYRLNANTVLLDDVDEHFRPGRRPSVLVVEDSDEWAQAITEELNRRGFEIRLARWTGEAKEMMAESPDLVSLDLELPATEEEWLRGEADARRAVEFLSYIRDHREDCPVAILTAIPWRDSVMLKMLRQGVRIDDYLSKHWDSPLRRLANSLARLWQESLTRTRILDWDPLMPLHPIIIDPVKRVLTEVAGFPVRPSGEGMRILELLSATPNVFVSRAQLLEEIYGSVEEGPDDLERSLNQHIKRLRSHIKQRTGGAVQGDEVICGDRGIYWLRGLVQ